MAYRPARSTIQDGARVPIDKKARGSSVGLSPVEVHSCSGGRLELYEDWMCLILGSWGAYFPRRGAAARQKRQKVQVLMLSVLSTTLLMSLTETLR
jgi:hypothetical protein